MYDNTVGMTTTIAIAIAFIKRFDLSSYLELVTIEDIGKNDFSINSYTTRRFVRGSGFAKWYPCE